MIEFTIPGKPVAKGRARSTKSGHHYTPQETVIFENKVAVFAKQAMQGKPPLEGGLCLACHFHIQRPDLHYGAKGVKERFAEVKHTSKPDVTNLVKSIEDGCNGIVWHDDRQIYRIVATKVWDRDSFCNVTVATEIEEVG